MEMSERVREFPPEADQPLAEGELGKKLFKEGDKNMKMNVKVRKWESEKPANRQTGKLIALAAVCVLMLVSAAICVQAGVPQLINYQGRLTDASGVPLTGPYSITFSIYDAPSGGTALWTETQTEVSVTNGLFNVLLGSVTEIPTTIFEEKDRYLGIKVGTDSEMIPRRRMVSVGYAFNADRVKGSEATDNVFSSSGNVGIGTTSPVEKLEVSGNIKVSQADAGIILPNSSGGCSKIYIDQIGQLRSSVVDCTTGVFVGLETLNGGSGLID